MKKSIYFLLFYASLALPSGLHAQYQWHVVHSDRIDTFYYSFKSISCSGKNCSAVGVVWGYMPPELPSQQMPDSNIILHSTDGGETWLPIDASIPQWHFDKFGKARITFNGIDQIDSSSAFAAGSANNAVISTTDNWKTWRPDTNFAPVIQNGQPINFNFRIADFSNRAEGVVTDYAVGEFLYTIDSGTHWVQRPNNGIVARAYGHGMFREYIPSLYFPSRHNKPDTILTTHDDWNNTDTSLTNINGPFSDPSVNMYSAIFGNGDTIWVIGYRWDTYHRYRSVMIARSSNLGADWSELPVPSNNAFDPISGTISPINFQTIVIAGLDSSERILLSTDQGVTWQAYTVPLDNGMPYFKVTALSITDSGRVLASILTDSNFEGSEVLAYLEQGPLSVESNAPARISLSLYPNPAANFLNIEAPSGTISILDPLGRSYLVHRSGEILDVSSLPSGVYFVSDSASRAKFVKE